MARVRRYSKRSGVIPSEGDIWVRMVGSMAGKRIRIHGGEHKNEDGELGYAVYPVGGGPGYFLTEDEILEYYGREEDDEERVILLPRTVGDMLKAKEQHRRRFE